MTIPEMAGWNLALRFGLEMAALFAIGAGGWFALETWPRYLLAGLLPILAISIWGIFNVVGDPSRSGNAPVAVPGFVRLFLELLILGTGAYSMFAIWGIRIALVFGSLIFVHYAFAWKRISWLVRLGSSA